MAKEVNNDASKEAIEELKNKLFDPEQYSTLIIGAESESEANFDKLFDFIKNPENKEFKNDTLKIFRDDISMEVIMEFLKNESDESKRAQMLCLVWESNMDATKQIKFWVETAIKGSFLECIEILSIIENIEIEVSSEEVSAAQKMLAKAKNSEGNEQKAGMLDAIEDALEYIKSAS